MLFQFERIFSNGGEAAKGARSSCTHPVYLNRVKFACLSRGETKSPQHRRATLHIKLSVKATLLFQTNRLSVTNAAAVALVFTYGCRVFSQRQDIN